MVAVSTGIFKILKTFKLLKSWNGHLFSSQFIPKSFGAIASMKNLSLKNSTINTLSKAQTNPKINFW